MKNPKLRPWLEAGIKRFANAGLDGINVNEISAELKISKTSFYHFFGSKEEYIRELFEHWLQEGTINLVRQAFLKDDPADIIRELFKKVIFENYTFEKFLSQVINSQNSIPFSSKFLNESTKFRQATLDGLLTRLGLTPAEARKRGINLQMHVLGWTQYHFNKEPSSSEKEEYFQSVFEMFFPEILNSDKDKNLKK